MKKIIITESQLKKIISEEQNIIKCSKLGVNNSGMCDVATKKPVVPCHTFGIRSAGYCFVDTKQEVGVKYRSRR